MTPLHRGPQLQVYVEVIKGMLEMMLLALATMQSIFRQPFPNLSHNRTAEVLAPYSPLGARLLQSRYPN